MVAQVEFLKDRGPKKLYDYFTQSTDDVEVGALVVVPAGASLSIAKVKRLATSSTKANAFIIQVIPDDKIKRARDLSESYMSVMDGLNE